MSRHPLMHILHTPAQNEHPTAADVWSGGYKIPWNDPTFSKRMLREHLTQDHDLASRKAESIAAQTAWIQQTFLAGTNAFILDLGCGPGLYAQHWLANGHYYHGIDFGPASIAYAQQTVTVPEASFVLGDILTTPYGGPYDMVTLLYGELNVFPPQSCRTILHSARKALKKKGRIILEVHTEKAVRHSGTISNWYKATSGLFSDTPHLCLMESRWHEHLRVARQTFHIIHLAQEGTTEVVETYHSTMQAWSVAEYQSLLTEAGFSDIRVEDAFPGSHEDLMLITAVNG